MLVTRPACCKQQRISTYESQSEALNADQKKSVAGKPALEAVQRELGDLIKVFEGEEADEAKNEERRREADRKNGERKVAAAVKNAEVSHNALVPGHAEKRAKRASE